MEIPTNHQTMHTLGMCRNLAHCLACEAEGKLPVRKPDRTKVPPGAGGKQGPQKGGK